MKDFEDVHSDQDHSRVAGQFAELICVTGHVPDRDKIMSLRQRWMQTNGLDEQDFYVLVVYSKRRGFEEQDLAKMPGPVSQLYGSRSRPLDGDRLDDRLSMLGRVRLVRSCQHGSEQPGLLQKVLCSREPLDVTKAYAEIEGTKGLNAGTRYELRKMVRETAAYHARTKAEVSALAKQDPGIAKLVEIADATFKKWATPDARRAKLVGLVAAMEAATDANKLSAFQGCDASTKQAWEAHLATLTMPKVGSEGVLTSMLEATLDSTEGYLAYQALQLCSAGLENNPYQGIPVTGSEVIRRGPRTETIAAWLAAANEIRFDDRTLAMSQLLRALGLQEGNRWQDVRHGVIDKIEPAGDRVTISFRKLVEPREDCLQWVETNRIVVFAHDGRPIYRRNCVKWGKVKWDLTPRPIHVGKVKADGLRPGMYLYALEQLPIVATQNAKSTKPIWVFGGSLE